MRPFFIDIIKYAAIDVFILILIYRKIKQIIINNEIFAKLEDVNKDVLLNKTSMVNSSISKNFKTKKKDKGIEIQSYKNTLKDFLLYVDSMILILQSILLNLVKKYSSLKNANITILSVGKIVSLKYTYSLEDKILFIFDELKVRFDEKHIPKNVLIVKHYYYSYYYYDFSKDSENYKKNPCLEEINKENLQNDLLAENEIGFYNVDKEMCYSNGFLINMVGEKLYHNKNKMFFSKFTLLKIILCFVVILAHSQFIIRLNFVFIKYSITFSQYNSIKLVQKKKN
uniref:Uncharacterized protein n=1 Tax=Strongyloides stercoralis TaxID=6248 RepID=A0AAF5DME0_STRER